MIRVVTVDMRRLPPGAHTFVAIARDPAGNTATSDPITVTRPVENHQFIETVDASGLSAGSHTVVAKAFDPTGNIGTSAAITIIVPAVVAPTVRRGLRGLNPDFLRYGSERARRYKHR